MPSTRLWPRIARVKLVDFSAFEEFIFATVTVASDPRSQLWPRIASVKLVDASAFQDHPMSLVRNLFLPLSSREFLRRPPIA